MSLRGQKPEAIQLLPIYKGRKSVEYKSPKCPIMVTKMSTNLHFLSNFCTQKLMLGKYAQPTNFWGLFVYKLIFLLG